MGRVCDYVPGRPASYGRGRLGNETAKVAEEEGLACNGGTGGQESNTGSTRLRHTQGVLSRGAWKRTRRRRATNKHFKKAFWQLFQTGERCFFKKFSFLNDLNRMNQDGSYYSSGSSSIRGSLIGRNNLVTSTFPLKRLRYFTKRTSILSIQM